MSHLGHFGTVGRDLAHSLEGLFGFILGVFALYLGVLEDFFRIWDNLARFLYGVAQWDKMTQGGYLEGWEANWTPFSLHFTLNAPFSCFFPLYCLSTFFPLRSFSSGFRGHMHNACICNDLQKPQTGESC